MVARLAIVLLVMAGMSEAARAGEVPRYTLRVGEVLTYHGSLQSREAEGKARGAEDEIQLLVTGQEGDGWRVMLRARFANWSGEKPAKMPEAGEWSMGTLTLFPNGRIEVGMGANLDIRWLFVGLPGEEKEAGGYVLNGESGAPMRVRVATKAAGEWGLATVVEDPIYELTRRSTITVAGGVPVRVDESHTSEYGGHGTGESHWVLTDRTFKGEPWAAQMDGDVQALARAQGVIREALEQLSGSRERMRQSLLAAGDSYKQAREGVKSPEVLAELDQRIRGFPEGVDYDVEAASKRQEVENKPAGDWTLERLDGGKVSLKELKGKVVVLDFWYRGCGWCTESMPQMKQVATDFNDRGVVVLGMNVDAAGADAQAVVKAMKLNYETLRASHDFEKMYGFEAYPTFVVIDREGIVRKVHSGYRVGLRAYLGGIVEKVLGK